MEYSIKLEYCGKKAEWGGNAQAEEILATGDGMIEKALKESE